MKSYQNSVKNTILFCFYSGVWKKLVLRLAGLSHIFTKRMLLEHFRILAVVQKLTHPDKGFLLKTVNIHVTDLIRKTVVYKMGYQRVVRKFRYLKDSLEYPLVRLKREELALEPFLHKNIIFLLHILVEPFHNPAVFFICNAVGLYLYQ